MSVPRSGPPRPWYGNGPPDKGRQDREKNCRAAGGPDDPGTDLLARDTVMALLELAWLRMFAAGFWEFVQ